MMDLNLKTASPREIDTAHRSNRFAPSSALIAAISAAVERDDHDYYGLRIEHGRRFATGDELPDSRVWVDGEETDETLDGVATLRLPHDPDDDEIAKVLSEIGSYYGDALVLVGGTFGGYGEDVGEAIIRDAICLEIWTDVE